MVKSDFKYCPQCGSEFNPQIDICSACGVTLVNGAPMTKPLRKIEWVEAGQFSGNVFGEMAGEILTKNNIPYFLKADFFSTAFNASLTNLPGAVVKLFVPKDKKETAERLISDVVE